MHHFIQKDSRVLRESEVILKFLSAGAWFSKHNMSSLKDIVIIIQNPDRSNELISEITLQTYPYQNTPKLFFELRSEIYELQVAQPRRFGSWFINQRVSSSKSIYFGSKIDPRFLCLPFFERNTRYSPLDQIIVPVDGFSNLPLGNVKEWKLEEICDVNDKIDDSVVFYRYNVTKILVWLKFKVQRIAQTICKQRLSKASSTNPSFVRNFDISKQTQTSAPRNNDLEVSITGTLYFRQGHMSQEIKILISLYVQRPRQRTPGRRWTSCASTSARGCSRSCWLSAAWPQTTWRTLRRKQVVLAATARWRGSLTGRRSSRYCLSTGCGAEMWL